MIFLEADLSQIESRLVFLFTGDKELVRLAQLPSYEYDAHTENIVVVGLARSMDEVLKIKKADPKKFKQLRHVGKITSHGAQRDMRGAKLAGNILKELDLHFSAEKCDGYIANYHAKRPAIRGVYFRDIRKQMMRDRMLVNSWGRQIDFRYDRLDDDLFRQGYSWLPQSENADLLNQHGVIPTHLYMKSLLGYPPNVQVHDSLLCSVSPVEAYDLARFIQHNLEKPILIAGVKFRPFVEFKLGKNWGADEKLGEGFEFKQLPSYKEFTERATWLDRS